MRSSLLNKTDFLFQRENLQRKRKRINIILILMNELFSISFSYIVTIDLYWFNWTWIMICQSRDEHAQILISIFILINLFSLLFIIQRPSVNRKEKKHQRDRRMSIKKESRTRQYQSTHRSYYFEYIHI